MTVPVAGQPLPSVPAIWGNVPARNKNFTGRSEIFSQLRDGASDKPTAVLPEQGPGDPLPLAVQGLGGVGKTAIAIEYAWRYRPDYDLVWWIPADQVPSARASLAGLAKRLNLEQTSAASGIEGDIIAVLDALRRGDPYRRWLLVFDNADRPEDISDLIPSGPGHVLITSRNHRWKSVVNTIPMNVFIRAESQEFLGKRVPRGLSAADTDRLAERLGDLPLALEQAGAMLSETGMPIDEYLRQLDEHVTAIMAEGKSPDYPYSMTAAWMMSVDALHESLPDARELLRCCAFFGPEPIPRVAFRPGTKDIRTPVGKLLVSPILLSRAIGELGRYALVTLEGQSFQVHRLIQALLRDGLTAEERADYQHDAQLIMAAAAPDDPDDPQSWPLFRLLLPHVNSESTELPKSVNFTVRDLVRKVMRYLYQSGDFASALQIAERFIDQWVADSGPEDENVLRARRHQGNILRILGRYPEAHQLTRDTLASCEATLGEDNATTLSVRSAYAADLRARGDFSDALRTDMDNRGKYEATYGVADRRTLQAVAALALDYGLVSEYAQARDLYEEAYLGLTASRWVIAQDVLSAQIGLAWALRLLGQYQEAFDVGQAAMDYGQDPDRLGAEHLATLRSITGFTVVSRRLPNRRADALDLTRGCLDLCSRRYGEAHPDSLALAVSLSNLLRTIGHEHHQEALTLAEKTAAMYPRAYGADHPYTYGCQSNVALLKREAGDPETARKIDEAALEGLRNRVGGKHHFTLTIAMNLASDLALLGRAEEARQVGEDTLQGLTDLLGPDHPHALGCAANLALDMIAAGDEAAGQELQFRTWRSYGATLGSKHPDTIAAYGSNRLDLDFDPFPI